MVASNLYTIVLIRKIYFEAFIELFNDICLQCVVLGVLKRQSTDLVKKIKLGIKLCSEIFRIPCKICNSNLNRKFITAWNLQHLLH